MADTTELSRLDRIALAEQAHAERRIIQHDWRRRDEGRELVCALAAFGPDINSSDDCPADLMPQWLATLVPSIDDGIAKEEVPWFSGELISRAGKWHTLDDAAWERIRTGFMVAGIKQAIAHASKAQPDPVPEYWAQVTSACDAVVLALETGKNIREAQEAARAAEAAAWAAAWAAEAAARAAEAAAWAAAWAAEAAARAAEAAAWAAAWAAEAAAWAAARAAEAAAWAAAWAAEAAAWKELAVTLFALIDAELATVTTDAKGGDLCRAPHALG